MISPLVASFLLGSFAVNAATDEIPPAKPEVAMNASANQERTTVDRTPIDAAAAKRTYQTATFALG